MKGILCAQSDSLWFMENSHLMRQKVSSTILEGLIYILSGSNTTKENVLNPTFNTNFSFWLI